VTLRLTSEALAPINQLLPTGGRSVPAYAHDCDRCCLGTTGPTRAWSTIPRGAQRARLEQEIKLARQRGYATSRGEIFVGAVAVSAPYFDHRGSVVGSVGIYGPSARVDEQKMVEYSKLTRKAGQKISVALGFKKLAAQKQKERQ
jgi:DNA-binding IclR family transcriptional regulator